MNAGRITVERGDRAIGLRLSHWNLCSDAILTLDEARELVRLINEALKPVKEA